jgi:hypothetical protein
MCTLQKPKKRFDYEAYIQGRLVGEYVVIYHDEIDETSAQEIIKNPDIPTEDTEVTTVLPKDSSPVIFERTVPRADFTLPYYSEGSAYIGLPNPKGSPVYRRRLVLPVTPMIACSRAGPN